LSGQTLPVTAIVPAYNRAALITRALSSIQRQEPAPPAEIIVVDDASTDRTADVATRLGARVIRHDRNRGLAAARNTGLEAARHHWVALLDSDDEWLPHHLDALWRIRDGHALVAASALWCGPDPAQDRFQGPLGGRPVVLRTPSRLLFTGNFIPASATMIRRAVALESGGFQSRHGVVEDLDLWARILDRHSAIVTPAVGLIYHVHEGQMSRNHDAMHAGHLAIAEEHRSRSWWSIAGIERLHATTAWDNLRLALAEQDRPRAARFAVAAVRNPRRFAGLLATWQLRFRVRRRSAMVTRDGTPSVTDVRGQSFARVLLDLARRPAGVVVVASPWQRRCLRVLGIRAVTPARMSHHH
jgi:hypothetical protein